MNETDIYRAGFANGAFLAILFQFVGIAIWAVSLAVCRILRGE